MTLDEYVKETLLAIARGVAAAQEDPDHGEYVGRVPNTATTDLQGNVITTVSFDLATTSEDKGTAGGGISVVSFAKVKGEASTAVSSANRIQFTVPLAVRKPPSQRTADSERDRRMNARI